jgi:hypothetical protein
MSKSYLRISKNPVHGCLSYSIIGERRGVEGGAEVYYSTEDYFENQLPVGFNTKGTVYSFVDLVDSDYYIHFVTEAGYDSNFIRGVVERIIRKNPKFEDQYPAFLDILLHLPGTRKL